MHIYIRKSRVNSVRVTSLNVCQLLTALVHVYLVSNNFDRGVAYVLFYRYR